MTDTGFVEQLTQKGVELYRDMPWRDDTRPYYVSVSELMLQQTQVSRVIPKFQKFISAFPDEYALAQATLSDVLKQWQGLGYNRRARYLHEAAKKIVEMGEFPSTLEGLMELPGVGKNTAGAIVAYSYNQPSVFIETNIRTVYIHHFFNDQFDVGDKEIVQKLTETLDHEHPREFYWALMDYGSWLKANGVRNTSSSKHYRRQAPLQGSVRQVRGDIVRQLADQSDLSISALHKMYPDDDRLDIALRGLIKDGLVSQTEDKLHLTN